ncbi:MAG: methyltransferase domain-containing protein [Caldithrix sp.]|nr:methyltransferase domain-containing protein [Caldithrix sp.]
MSEQKSTSVNYAALTTGDRNRVKRALQNRRLAHSTRVFKMRHPRTISTVLDFGAGNAELVRRLALRYPHIQFTAYEPAADLYEQAQTNVKDMDGVQVVQQMHDLAADYFDLIFCMEVFEHLPPAQTEQALQNMVHSVKADGRVIIGVPNEIYTAALFKGLFRMTRRYGDVDAKPGSVLRAALGFPPSDRPVTTIGDGLPYIARHMGFDHRRFRRRLQQYFIIEKKYGSPFPRLPSAFNFEQYFICRKDFAHVNH